MKLDIYDEEIKGNLTLYQSPEEALKLFPDFRHKLEPKDGEGKEGETKEGNPKEGNEKEEKEKEGSTKEVEKK